MALLRQGVEKEHHIMLYSQQLFVFIWAIPRVILPTIICFFFHAKTQARRLSRELEDVVQTRPKRSGNHHYIMVTYDCLTSEQLTTQITVCQVSAMIHWCGNVWWIRLKQAQNGWKFTGQIKDERKGNSLGLSHLISNMYMAILYAIWISSANSEECYSI